MTVRELLLVLDLAGTFVFAISGAMLGVRHKLDIFGVLVLSFAASSAGGITRDLLINSLPPAAISDAARTPRFGDSRPVWASPASGSSPASQASAATTGIANDAVEVMSVLVAACDRGLPGPSGR